jgi:hypothetical protein
MKLQLQLNTLIILICLGFRDSLILPHGPFEHSSSSPEELYLRTCLE